MTAGEQVVLPSAVNQPNPYTYGVNFTSSRTSTAASASPSSISASAATAASELNGIVVQNLTSALAISSTAPNLETALRLESLQNQRASANLAQIKQAGPQVEIMPGATTPKPASMEITSSVAREPVKIYGYSVYNATSGECYLVELVPTDLSPPDRLPNASQNTTYDPYYVRVVFVQRLKAYNLCPSWRRRSRMISSDTSQRRPGELLHQRRGEDG